MDFFLWGHIEAPIYTTAGDSKEDRTRIARILEAAATFRQQPGILERTCLSQLRRCRLCIEVGGRTFEHPL